MLRNRFRADMDYRQIRHPGARPSHMLRATPGGDWSGLSNAANLKDDRMMGVPPGGMRRWIRVI